MQNKFFKNAVNLKNPNIEFDIRSFITVSDIFNRLTTRLLHAVERDKQNF